MYTLIVVFIMLLFALIIIGQGAAYFDIEKKNQQWWDEMNRNQQSRLSQLSKKQDEHDTDHT